MKAPLPFVFLFVPLAVSAQPGTLDPTFGSNGKAVAMVTGNYSSGEAIAEQADGRIVVCGATPGSALLARFLPDGTLDAGFGNNGLVLTDVDAGNDFAGSVAVQPDGRIVAGGVRFNASAVGQAIVMRHLSNGTLDNSFGTGGIRTITFTGPGSSFIKGLVLQPDGRIVACGERYTGSAWKSFVVRLGTDGTTDSGFGIVELEVNAAGDDNATDIALQDDGRIVVCGSTMGQAGGGMFVVRLNSDGTFDSSFGTSGRKVLDIGGGGSDKGNGVRVQPDGRILVCGVIDGSSGYRLGAARLMTDGTLDPSFATGGAAQFDLGVDGQATPSLALQPDGRILISTANNTASAPRVKVVRLLGDGMTDPAFGTSGIGTSNATSGNNEEAAVRTLFLSDGGIAVVGSVDTPNNIQVAVWKFSSGSGMGIAGPLSKGSISAAPNPALDFVVLTGIARSDIRGKVMLLDAAGTALEADVTRSAQGLRVDTGKLAPGVYTLSFTTAEGAATARFIKQ